MSVRQPRGVSLRVKTALILATAVACMVMLLYTALSSMLLRQYRELEHSTTSVNAERAADALRQAIADLHTKSSDWAYWDDTYKFLIDHNAQYEQSNLTSVTLDNLHLDLIAIVDLEGRVVAFRARDPRHQPVTAIPAALARQLSRGQPLVTPRNEHDEHSGVMLLPEGPLLLSARTVLTSNATGPPHGTLIFARYVTPQVVRALGSQTHVVLAAWPIHDEGLPTGARHAVAALENGHETVVAPIDEDRVAGYTMVHDLFGEPGLMLRVVLPRSIYAEGVSTLELIFWSLLLVGVLVAIMTIWTLETWVLRRIVALSAEVGRIGRELVTGARIAVRGNDELSSLGGSLNEMLGRFDTAQTRLRESDLVLKSFYDKAAMLRGIVDLEGDDIVHIMDNANTTRLFGLADGATAGRRASELGVPLAIRRLWIDQYEESESVGQAVHFEYAHPTPEGPKFLSVWVCKIGESSDGRRRFAYVAEDVTADRIAAEQLVIARNEADAANRAKSAFLATMSHEIRTPMNGVLGMTGLLLGTPLTPTQRDYAETVQRSAESLLALINDILDFSKIEAGKLTLEPIAFDLAVMVDEVVEMFVPRAADKNLELVVRLASDVPRNLVGDAGRIRQILVNLVGNALKFTSAGHVLIDVSSEGGDARRVKLRFGITDTGIGLTEEQSRRLFRSFSQADVSTTRRYGGTGLGLAISRSLVELMGGEIGVESRPDAGSTFWFALDLPRAASDSNAAPDRPLAGRRVLLLDDLAVSRDEIVAQLAHRGADIVGVDSAPAALDCLTSVGARFDAVLIDFGLEGTNGASFGQVLAEHPGMQQITRILLTSQPSLGDAQRFQEMGFAGYLVKPVRADMLSGVLLRVVTTPPAARSGIVTRHTLRDGREGPQAPAWFQARFPGLHVLLAEDNAVNQKVASHMLERLGCRVDVANDGREAVRRAADTSYGLIFMDIQMPEMDGLAASAAIRAAEPGGRRVPIIALTANAMESDRNRCLAAGMDGFITKPMKPDALIAALREWCGTSEGTDSAPLPKAAA